MEMPDSLDISINNRRIPNPDVDPENKQQNKKTKTVFPSSVTSGFDWQKQRQKHLSPKRPQRTGLWAAGVAVGQKSNG